MSSPIADTTPPIPIASARLAINSIKVLAMDAVERAKSGHPGTPMALAPVGYLLWTRHLRHNPARPSWIDRDRFVLSCGHASMLLYSLLHLSGYDLPLSEIENFRQLHSKTPGHPERGHTVGVEVTTGPLGQGIGNSVGLAMAERYLAEHFNRPGHQIIDHRTWAMVSDGDLMEGVASEAASLAGHLKLGKLTLIYDDNQITIDGSTELSFSENVGQRFEAYGWRVLKVGDGNDLAALDQALDETRSQSDRPTLIIVRTVIADPAPTKRNTSEAHGAPLGQDEIDRTKEILGWPKTPFYVPDEAREHWELCGERGAELTAEWDEQLTKYRAASPELASELDAWFKGKVTLNWDQALPKFGPTDALASRQASGTTLASLINKLPNLIGGSADLATSTGTAIKGLRQFTATQPGQLVAWGIREHAMGAAMNGIAAHGGLRPFGSTFLVFADYVKPAIRLAALSKFPVIYVFTHDSIGVGEDGPTHQPIEHLAMLRSIPNTVVIRPGTPAETAQAWRVALERTDGPTILVLSRQKLAPVDHSSASAENLSRGGYILWEPDEAPQAIIISTGSEIGISLAAAKQLSQSATPTRLVSLPSWELFKAQPPSYRDKILPPSLRARVSVEAATTFGWLQWVTDSGFSIGIDHFGASAPGEVLFREFGFSAEAIVKAVNHVVERR